MELSKLLLKLLYLFLICVMIYFILMVQTPLIGLNLIIITLVIGVFIMYFTFDYVYKFLINSEIIFKNTTDTSNNKTADDKDQKNKSHDKSLSVGTRNYIYDHTHKYIESREFS